MTSTSFKLHVLLLFALLIVVPFTGRPAVAQIFAPRSGVRIRKTKTPIVPVKATLRSASSGIDVAPATPDSIKRLPSQTDFYPNVGVHSQNMVATVDPQATDAGLDVCLLYTSPSPRDQRGSRMPSSA